MFQDSERASRGGIIGCATMATAELLCLSLLKLVLLNVLIAHGHRIQFHQGWGTIKSDASGENNLKKIQGNEIWQLQNAYRRSQAIPSAPIEEAQNTTNTTTELRFVDIESCNAVTQQIQDDEIQLSAANGLSSSLETEAASMDSQSSAFPVVATRDRSESWPRRTDSGSSS